MKTGWYKGRLTSGSVDRQKQDRLEKIIAYAGYLIAYAGFGILLWLLLRL